MDYTTFLGLAGDPSLSMFSMVFLGTVAWLVYGLLKHDLPIIWAKK